MYLVCNFICKMFRQLLLTFANSDVIHIIYSSASDDFHVIYSSGSDVIHVIYSSGSDVIRVIYSSASGLACCFQFLAISLLWWHARNTDTTLGETEGKSNFDMTKTVMVTETLTNTGANTQASNSYECGRNDDSHTLKTRHKRETWTTLLEENTKG